MQKQTYEILKQEDTILNSFRDFKIVEKIGRYDVYILSKYYPLGEFPDEILEKDERLLRQIIYKFKDGEKEVIENFANIISRLLVKIKEDPETVFCVIPASTKRATKLRFKKFSKIVSKNLLIKNGFSYIKNKKNRLPKHLSGNVEDILEYLEINSKKIKDKIIILFDDILTSGKSFLKIANTLKAYGAKDVIGVFLAKTVEKEKIEFDKTVYSCLFYPAFFESILSEQEFNFFSKFTKFKINEIYVAPPKKDTPLILAAKIYNNILQRGIPTYSSLYFEKQLERKYSLNPYISRYISELKNLLVSANNIFAASILSSWLHKTLVFAIVEGILKEKKVWNIAVLEEDTSFSKIAVEDFYIYMNNLSKLFNFKFPKIRLTIIREDEIKEIEKSDYIEVKYKHLSEIRSNEEFDLFVDIGLSNKKKKYTITDQKNLIFVFPLYYEIPVKIKQFYDFEVQRYELDENKKSAMEFILKNVFKKENFRDGQFEIITRMLNLENFVGLLPTGSGKSLTYQISSLLQPGVVIVIDPIKSLMVDQVKKLKEYGITSCAYINSEQSREEKNIIMDNLKSGKLKLIFVSPERLQIREFRKLLKEMELKIPIIVFDEAHCISEWGHDFRPSYLNVSKNIRKILKSDKVSIAALTGTASYAILNDIMRILSIKDKGTVYLPETFDRKELYFEVIKTKEKEKALKEIINKKLPEKLGDNVLDKYVGIIFTSVVEGKKGILEIHKILSSLNLRSNVYSGKKPSALKIKDYEAYKREVQHKFLSEEVPLLVATKAFGMGIDKSNIRYIIHYNLPSSIEAFYQEAGRAGRDRKNSYCYLIFSEENPRISDIILNPNTPNEIARKLFENYDYIHDDVFTQLSFHFSSYKGLKYEINETIDFYRKIRGHISTLKEGEYKFIQIKSRNKRIERIIYRLHLLGIVDDYTVDYIGKDKLYEIKVSKKSREEIIKNLKIFILEKGDYLKISEKMGIEEAITFLIEYIYEKTEKQRRKALLNMVELARNAKTNAEVKRFILNYFNESIYTKEILEIIYKFNELKLFELIEKLKSENEMEEIMRLDVNLERLFENYPDNIYLHILKAFVELKKKEFVKSLNHFKKFYINSEEHFRNKALKNYIEYAKTLGYEVDKRKLLAKKFKKAKVTVLKVF
ncbi:MAG: RecQ family ATP-dependent DNA helicase [Thermosipho sp. (in: Bacteria)]|nr:RecQ family ATP-dependent DNA helicase [Thermosipho sp. (in: thermotogales)]